MKQIVLLILVLLSATAHAEEWRELRFLEMQTISFGGVTSSYQEVLENDTASAVPLKMVSLINDADCNLYVSYDGTTDHDYIPANSSRDLFFASRLVRLTKSVYLKHDGSACTSGFIGVSGAY